VYNFSESLELDQYTPGLTPGLSSGDFALSLLSSAALSNTTPALSSAEPLIRMSGVVKDYQTAAGAFRALKGVNLAVHPGEFVAILGGSGAGKTTLVNMLTGVDHLTEGEVWVGETPIHRLSEERLAQWRGRYLGIIYQSFYLMPNLSLLDNVMLPMDLNGLYRPGKSRARALELLRQVELEEHATKLPSGISGGQQQRVAIARALANDPPLIVADEPTGRLDSTTAETIFQIFETLHRQGKTILMVTHDRSLAGRVSRSITLHDGEISGAV
jgi:putative ABC transport system ATP-binding protein